MFLICKTMEGWSYEEVLRMPEYEREQWFEHCKDYQEKVGEDMKKAQKKARGGKRPRRR